MSDLDARIREKLRYPDVNDPNAEPNALRAVLDLCDQWDEVGGRTWAESCADEARAAIADALGVSGA